MNASQLETWDIERLIPYIRNPRKNDDAVDRMCGSIQEFGFRIPVLAKSTGELIDGHLRLKAARRLGLTEIPVLLADDMTDAQVKAFRIMVNKSATWADFDLELLDLELQDLKSLGYDLTLTGFSDFELQDLESMGQCEDIGLTDEDDAPPLSEDAVTRLGDVWVLGTHRLLCGDSTVPDDYSRLFLDGEIADMVFTDPPYNVNYGATMKDKLRGKNRTIMNDALGEQFGDFLQKALTEIVRHCRGAIYVAMSSSELDTLQAAFRTAGGHWSTFIIWAKNTFTLGRADYQRQYEPILYGWPDGAERHWCGARDQGDVWQVAKPVKNDLHPTMKPVELVIRALRNSSKFNDIVFDGFAGSGSTMIACQRLGRRARCIELDPRYCDVIVQRWQDFAGKTARLDGENNVTFEEIKARRDRERAETQG